MTASQLPFGSVPFRHIVSNRRKWQQTNVSITFRLSALSALLQGESPFRGQWDVSITFRLSALSARKVTITLEDDVRASLNYLSAQCPFGTNQRREWVKAHMDESQLPFGSVPFRHGDVHRSDETTPVPRVSITFRLSALSAHSTDASQRRSGFPGLNYLSAQCPFGTDVIRVAQEDGTGTSQLPFGSVPFRHGNIAAARAVVDEVSITFRLSALSALLSNHRLSWSLHRASQLPFGSVPFRHNYNTRKYEGNNKTRLNYLSAQCPFGTLWFLRHYPQA